MNDRIRVDTMFRVQQQRLARQRKMIDRLLEKLRLEKAAQAATRHETLMEVRDMFAAKEAWPAVAEVEKMMGEGDVKPHQVQS